MRRPFIRLSDPDIIRFRTPPYRYAHKGPGLFVRFREGSVEAGGGGWYLRGNRGPQPRPGGGEHHHLSNVLSFIPERVSELHEDLPYTEYPNSQVKNFLRLLYSQLSSDEFALNLKVALATRP